MCWAENSKAINLHEDAGVAEREPGVNSWNCGGGGGGGGGKEEEAAGSPEARPREAARSSTALGVSRSGGSTGGGQTVWKGFRGEQPNNTTKGLAARTDSGRKIKEAACVQPP